MYYSLLTRELALYEGAKYRTISKDIEIGDLFTTCVDFNCPVLTCGDVTSLGMVMSVETGPNSSYPYLFEKKYCLVIERIQ